MNNYSGGPSAIIVDGEWLELLPTLGLTGNTLVRKSPDSVFNQTCRFCFLKYCEAYNVALLSQDPADPDCITYAVVDKAGRQPPWK